MTQTQEENPRVVGTETLVNRVFRQVVVRHLLEAGKLPAVRDEFLALLNGHPSARKTDKSCAARYADDMTTAILGAAAHPAPPSPPSPPPTPADDLDLSALLDRVDPGEVSEGSIEELIQGALDHSPLGRMSDKGGPLDKILGEFLATKREHPFLRSFNFEGQRYVALGTVMGVIPDGQYAGRRLNIHMTVAPFRRFRDVPETIAPTFNGRQISVVGEVASREYGVGQGLKKFLFVVKHTPGLKIRWWLRLGNQDEMSGTRFVVLTDDDRGWKQVTRSEF